MIPDAHPEAGGGAVAQPFSFARLSRHGQWPGIEFRHLAALEAVAEEASFNRAASRLGYTQSAISQQIAALERAVGQVLIERRGGSLPVVLTPAGRLLMHHACAVGSHLAAAHADLSALAGGTIGVVRVGTIQTLGTTILPQILRCFARRVPGVKIDLLELPGDARVLELLARGDLDVALAHLPLAHGPFGAEPVLCDEYVLVTRLGAPLARRVGLMSAKEIADLPLIGFRSCRCLDPLAAHLGSLGLRPRYIFHADSMQTVLGLVAEDFGATIVPRLAIEGHAGGVEVCTLGHLALPRRVVGAVWQSDRVETAAAIAFRDAALSVGRRAEGVPANADATTFQRVPA